MLPKYAIQGMKVNCSELCGPFANGDITSKATPHSDSDRSCAIVTSPEPDFC